MKICHLTSVHQQEDIRIFHKECVSLAQAGYETYQISCGSSYKKNGVQLLGIGERPSNRIKRFLFTARKVYKEASALDADIYHFHDPELFPYALKLKKKGKKIIFDSHEDIPATIVDKNWIPSLLRKIIANAYKKYETYSVGKIDAVVTATPHIAEKFKGRCKKVVAVNNFPKLDDIIFQNASFLEKEPIVCYAGGIDNLRGEQTMIEAIKNVDAFLVMAGKHEVVDMCEGKVKYVGMLNREEINELYKNAVVGLCLLKPVENYYYARPIKMYEYMAAGIPYVCSDFPEWKEVTNESNAGIAVNPENVSEISEKISELLNNRELAQQMGQNGRRYVLDKCNWDNERKTLISLYEEIMP